MRKTVSVASIFVLLRYSMLALVEATTGFFTWTNSFLARSGLTFLAYALPPCPLLAVLSLELGSEPSINADDVAAESCGILILTSSSKLP